jgi:hypothetical protein
MTPQHAPPPSATRVDLHTPPRAAVPQQQPPSNHRPAAAPQYSQRPKPASSPLSSKSKKSTIYTALAIVAAAVIGIMFASMISNNNDKGGNGNNANGNTQTQQTQNSEPSAANTPKLADKAGKWTTAPSEDERRVMLDDYFTLATTAPDEAWKLGNTDFQANYPGGLAGFKSFWANYKQAKVVTADQQQEFYFVVSIEVTKKDGTKTTMQRQISQSWRGANFLLSYDKPFGSGT